MGLARLLLAIWVVDEHGGSVWPGHFEYLTGRESVQLFYVMSGFYMTLVLNTKYVTPRDNWTFYLNRFLRLWPPFAIVALLTATLFLLWHRVVLFHLDQPLSIFVNRLSNLDPLTLIGLSLTNLFIFGQDLLWYLRIDPSGVDFAPFRSSALHNGSSFSINHPIFTVAIELTFYLAAPFILRKSLVHLLGWLLLGASYHAFLYLIGRYEIAFSYHLTFSAIYFFALGACSYHLWRRVKEELKKRDARQRIWLRLGIAALCGVLIAQMFQALGLSRMLGLAAAFAAVLPLIFELTRASAADRMLGDLSYPIYIVHYPVLTVLIPIVLPLLPDPSYGRWLEGPVVIGSALLLLFLVDLPIDRARQRLARRGAPGAAIGSPAGPPARRPTVAD